MNEYEIISERVGTPGEKYTPEPGVNADALVQHGFIKPISKTKPKKDEE